MSAIDPEYALLDFGRVITLQGDFKIERNLNTEREPKFKLVNREPIEFTFIDIGEIKSDTETKWDLTIFKTNPKN